MEPFCTDGNIFADTQHAAGNHEQSQGFVTILVINNGIITYISILTVGICHMTIFHIDKPQESFLQEVKWTLAICSELSTHSGLDLCCIRHLAHALIHEMILIVWHKGINEFATLCGGFTAVEIMMLTCVVPCSLNE
jgi:hypothetical protein